jgi:hypothetical protein
VATITGCQLVVDEHAGQDGSIDLTVICLGTDPRTCSHRRYPNVTFKQHEPRITPRELAPYISRETLLFLLKLVPWRTSIVCDIVAERPEKQRPGTQYV